MPLQYLEISWIFLFSDQRMPPEFLNWIVVCQNEAKNQSYSLEHIKLTDFLHCQSILPSSISESLGIFD